MRCLPIYYAIARELVKQRSAAIVPSNNARIVDNRVIRVAAVRVSRLNAHRYRHFTPTRTFTPILHITLVGSDEKTNSADQLRNRQRSRPASLALLSSPVIPKLRSDRRRSSFRREIARLGDRFAGFTLSCRFTVIAAACNLPLPLSRRTARLIPSPRNFPSTASIKRPSESPYFLVFFSNGRKTQDAF